MDEKQQVSFLHFVMLVCMLAIRTRIRGRLLHVQLSASADVMLGSVVLFHTQHHEVSVSFIDL